MAPRLTLRLLGAGAIALAVVTCSDALTGPRRYPAARIALAPSFSTDARRIMGRLSDFALDVNTVHLVIVRPPSEILKDTTVAFPAGVDTLSIELDVDLKAAEETLQAQVELRDNDILLFSGTQTVLAKRGQTTGGSDGGTVTLSYAGPGNGAATLSIVQRTPAIATGGTIQLATSVLDAQGQPVTGLPLSWTSGDATRLTIDANGVARSIGKPGTVWAKVEGLNGSKDSVTVAISQQATKLTVVSGNAQAVTAGAPLGAPMVVRVADALDQAMPSAKVAWRVKSGGGSIGADTTTSDASGDAQTTYTSGTTSGTAPTIVASIGVDSVTFTQGTVSPAAAAQLGVLAQPTTAQQAKVMTPAPQVQLQDQFGNGKPQAGVPITVALGTGAAGRTLAGTLTVNTDAAGTATFPDLAISGPTGSVTLAFSATGLTGVQSTAIAFTNSDPATIAVVAGDGQKDTVGKQLAQPLQVKITDAQSVAVPNATIDWAITSGSASFSGTASSATTTTTTAADGSASTPLWLGNSAGEVVVTATVRGFPLVATFKDTAVAGGPQALQIVQPSSDTVRSSLAFVRQPIVQLTDAFGNPIASPNWVVVANVDYDTPAQCTGGFQPARAFTPTTTPRFSMAPAPAAARRSALPPALLKRGVRPFVPPAVATVAPKPAPTAPVAAARRRFDALRNVRLPGGVQLSTLRARAARTAATRRPAARAASGGGRLAPAPLVTRSLSAPRLGNAPPVAPANSLTAASACPYAYASGTVSVNTDATGRASYADLGVWGYVGNFNYRVVYYAYDTTAVNPNVYGDSTPVVIVPGTPAYVTQVSGVDAFGLRYDSDTAYTTTGNSRWQDYYASSTSQRPVRLADTVAVFVADSSDNPIVGSKVQWTALAGSGTVDSATSTLDSAGVARGGRWTIPIDSGGYRLFAHVDEWADSLEFTTITVTPQPYYVTPVSGYDQAGAPGAALPLPIVVRVLDQYQFPMPGATVTWTVENGAGTLGAASSVADASGNASVTYTLSDSVAYTDMLSAATSFGYAYVYETIPATGTTRRWIGADTATLVPAWEDPANWSPAGVPTASDNVWISGTTIYRQPTLASDPTVNNARSDYTASIDFAGHTLTVAGDLGLYSTIDTGTVVLTGANANVYSSYSLPSLVVTNGATMRGYLYVNRDLSVSGGVLDLDTLNASVGGAFATSGTGSIKMVTPGVSLYVDGDATFGGGSTSGQITDGLIYVGGNFTQLSTNSPSSFVGSGNNTVYLTDTTTATVSFADPVNSRFAGLQVANTSLGGTVFGTPVNVDGSAYFNPSTRASGAGSLTVAGQLSINSGSDLSGLALATVTGSYFPYNVGVGPKLLRITGTIPSVGTADYAGAIAVDSGGNLNVDGQLRVRGDFSVTGASAAGVPSVIAMSNEVVQLTIDGSALFDGGDESSLLQYGTLTVRGDFTQKATKSKTSFVAGTAVTTVLDGSGPQNVSFATPDTASGSHFGWLNVANVSGSPVTFGDTVAVVGYVRVYDATATGKTAWLHVAPTIGALVIGGPNYLQLGANSHLTLDGGFYGAACQRDTTNVVIDGVNASQLANCGTTVLGFNRIAKSTPLTVRAPAPPSGSVTVALPKRDYR